MYFLIFLLIQIFLLPTSMQTAFATGYPAALPNHQVGIEVDDESDRMIAKIDWFSAAVDGQSYLRSLGVKDFYHGIGYWVQARTEFRPHENFHLNVRSVFCSGSFSGGYTEPTGNYHLFSFYGVWPETLAGGKLTNVCVV